MINNSIAFSRTLTTVKPRKNSNFVQFPSIKMVNSLDSEINQVADGSHFGPMNNDVSIRMPSVLGPSLNQQNLDDSSVSASNFVNRHSPFYKKAV